MAVGVLQPIICKYMLYKYLLGIFAFFFFIACTGKDKRLEQALEQTGTHRAELESVLHHYQDEPQKRAAAEFLIANMPGQYTLDGPFLDRYYELLDSMQSLPNVSPNVMKSFSDSIYKVPQWQELTRIYDLQTISSDYLINHIDAAFEAWKSPWAKSLTFEEFCEYLLPYRVGNERLEPWMYNFRNKYQYLMDSLGIDSVDSLYTCISNKYVGVRYYIPSYVPDCRPSSLEKIQIGSCRSYGSLALYIFRSLGIPIVREFTLNWSNHAMGHEWTTILIEGKNYPILLGDKDKFGEHMKNFVYRPTQIFRECYGRYRPLIEGEADVPSLFGSPRVKEVTEEYFPTTDIVLNDVFPFEGEKQRYAYLAIYDRHTWKTVACGKRKGNGFCFRHISPNAVYLPIYYSKGRYASAYHPIKVDSVGDWIPLIADTVHRRHAILKRKFMELSPKKWAKAMLGGYFVFSKNSHFTHSDTLWVDTLRDYGFQTKEIRGSYRYMKYVPPKRTEGNIGEIELYDKNGKQLKGQIIGNYCPKYLGSLESMQRAFDGKVLSYASTNPEQSDAWLGLDLGKVIELSQFAYLTRSDDNFIREGELYELYYWDRGWQSLGKRTGSRKLQYLVYNNVPENALLLLRNLTKGQEERIFTYEDGKQVWW